MKFNFFNTLKYSLSIIFLISIFHCEFTYALIKHHTRLWSGINVIGSLPKEKKIKYTIQPQIEFIDRAYTFQRIYVYAGIGYQLIPKMTLWLMNGWFQVQRSNGLDPLDIIRQQLDWEIANNSLYRLISITRLEEIKNSLEPEWAIRIRQRLTARVPFKNWKKHSLVLFDEVFFNLNNPRWIHNTGLLQQNRVFIGIGTQISKQTSFDIGYMNQYLFTTIRNASNILFVSLNVAVG